MAKTKRFDGWCKVPAVGLAAMTAACVSVPPIERPNMGVPLPEQWTAPVEADTIAGEVTTDPWWESFGDPTLNQLVQEALINNRDLREAAFRVEAALAQARIANAALRPQVDFLQDGRRANQRFVGLPIPGLENRVLNTTSSQVGISLNLSWELDLWGRLGAAKAATLADLEATAIDYRAAQLSLAAQTAKAWFAVLETQEQVGVARATLEASTNTRKRVENRFEGGLANSLDLHLARADEALARSGVEVRLQQLDSAKRQLEALLGRYPGARIETVDGLPETIESVPAGLPSDLLERRPDLLAAKLRVTASAARVAEARAAQLPRFSLTTSLGTTSNELDSLLDGDFSIWSLASNFLQPVFQGGRIRAQILSAEASLDSVLASWAQRAFDALTEVESALAGEMFLARQEEALKIAARESHTATRLAEERYRSGLVDFLFVLASQERAFAAENQLLAARRQRLDARVDLYLALGGGFDPKSADDIVNAVEPAPRSQSK